MKKKIEERRMNEIMKREREMKRGDFFLEKMFQDPQIRQMN